MGPAPHIKLNPLKQVREANVSIFEIFSNYWMRMGMFRRIMLSAEAEGSFSLTRESFLIPVLISKTFHSVPSNDLLFLCSLFSLDLV